MSFPHISDHTFVKISLQQNSWKTPITAFTWNLAERGRIISVNQKDASPIYNNPWSVCEVYENYVIRKKLQMQKIRQCTREVDIVFLQEADFVTNNDLFNYFETLFSSHFHIITNKNVKDYVQDVVTMIRKNADIIVGSSSFIWAGGRKGNGAKRIMATNLTLFGHKFHALNSHIQMNADWGDDILRYQQAARSNGIGTIIGGDFNRNPLAGTTMLGNHNVSTALSHETDALRYRTHGPCLPTRFDGFCISPSDMDGVTAFNERGEMWVELNYNNQDLPSNADLLYWARIDHPKYAYKMCKFSSTQDDFITLY